MRVLTKRVAKIEKAAKPQQAVPVIVKRIIVNPDGTVAGVITRP